LEVEKEAKYELKKKKKERNMHNATALGGREKGKIPIVETGLPFPLPLGSKLLNVDAALSINNPLYNNRQRSKSKDVILKFI
jgi:hypothetical protein